MKGFWQVVKAFFMMRCPHCRQGAIYPPRGGMNRLCAFCGLKFEREEGYFLGSLYVSYALASLFLGVGTFAISLFFPDVDLGWIILIVAVLFLPFVSPFTKYSRVLWIYVDRWLWAGD